MKLLHYASIILNVVDAFTGQTVKGATVQCTNANEAAKRNHEGHHLFSNLPLGSYTFQIICSGYCTQSITVDYETLNQPQIKTVGLAYSQMYPKLSQVNHMLFLLRTVNGALAHQTVRVQLQNKVALLRVRKDSKTGNKTLLLNGEGKTHFLRQMFVTERDETVIFLSIDARTKEYVLGDPLKSQLKKGECLFPVWDFKTDREGAFVLPIDPLLMSGEELNFSITCDQGRKEITVLFSEETGQRVLVEL